MTLLDPGPCRSRRDLRAAAPAAPVPTLVPTQVPTLVPTQVPALVPALVPAQARSAGSSGRAPRRHTAATLLRLMREVVLLTLGLLAYSAARLLGSDDVSSAFRSATDVIDIEQWLHLPREHSVQALLLRSDVATHAADLYYAAAHLPVTGLALLWLFLRRDAYYRWARRALIWSTSAALVVYLLLPVAPPRMMSAFGFEDTAAMFGLSVYGGSGATGLTNQYAAMPSLHVGWAVLVATVCIAAGHTRRRWLWVLHPTITLFVVVSTGNHYWLDAMAGTSVVVTALLLTRPHRAAVPIPAPAAPVLDPTPA